MGPAKKSSGMGTTPVPSVAKFIHGAAKGEVNRQYGAPRAYLNELLFLFSNKISTCS